jgi:hypothetical protein
MADAVRPAILTVARVCPWFRVLPLTPASLTPASTAGETSQSA